MTTILPREKQAELEASLRIVSAEDACDDGAPDIIPLRRLEEARAVIGREAYWAGRNMAMRRSARVAA
jgi:hypothetical protein